MEYRLLLGDCKYVPQEFWVSSLCLATVALLMYANMISYEVNPLGRIG